MLTNTYILTPYSSLGKFFCTSSWILVSDDFENNSLSFLSDLGEDVYIKGYIIDLNISSAVNWSFT